MKMDYCNVTHYRSVAEDRFLESLQLVERLPPEDSYTYFLAALKNFGLFYLQFKKFDLSASLYEKAHEVATEVNTVYMCMYGDIRINSRPFFITCIIPEAITKINQCNNSQISNDIKRNGI